MASTAQFVPQKFDIGRVFGMVFGVIGRNAPLYVGLGFLISGVPQILFQYFILRTVALSPATPGANPFAAMSGQFGYIGVFWVFSLLLGTLLHSGLSRATVEDLGGRRPNFGECLSLAASVLPQAIAISLLTGLAVGFASLLLVVPGIILWLGWCIAIPTLVQERAGISESMSRSRALTRGSRWALFGLFLIVVVAVGAIQMLFGAVAALTTSFGIAAITTAITTGISATISAVVMTTTAAASYVELRQVKEGTGVDELARIFA